MRDEVLDHKLHDDEGEGMYWEFPHGLPKGFGRFSRMWVANHGRWVGYFPIRFGEYGERVVFNSESFVRVDAGPRSPFMGYTLKVPPRAQGDRTSEGKESPSTTTD